MSFGERTESTQPTAVALRGIEPSRADPSWAKVILPSALIVSSPSVPSVDVPDRIAPILPESQRRPPQVVIVSYFRGGTSVIYITVSVGKLSLRV